MNSKQQDSYHDCLIFIGRFQPVHAGHLMVIREGLERAGMLIIICGSARQPRSLRNPWNVREREQMIRGSLTRAENDRVHIVPLPDNPYDEEAWRRELETRVNKLAVVFSGKAVVSPRIGFIGHDKNHIGKYPDLFPEWDCSEVPGETGVNATMIREHLFSATDTAAALVWLRCDQARAALPDHVIQSLSEFCRSAGYAWVKAEYDFIAEYRKAWGHSPYPPAFVTVDAVVVHGESLLLIERKYCPGKGLLALPGGFVNRDERLLDACIRELYEETRLDVSADVLKRSIRTSSVFDYPWRSERGRVVTHAFYIVLQPDGVPPSVRGSDDASHAVWTPLSTLDPEKLFEDHYFIIQKMIEP